MTVQRGYSSVIFSIVGIFVVVVVAIVIANVLSSNAPVQPLIYKSIALRGAVDPVDRANLISDIDDLVVQADSEDVSEQWDRMMQCLSSACPDEAYLDIVLVVVASFESDIPQSALLVNVIATAKYWGDGEHLLDFSKALSIANQQVDELDDKKISKSWESIVECNNVCAEKNDLYFEFIELVVQ